VQLVNARDVKAAPGRPKTDKLDAVWLAKLTERGMLRPSFVPPAEIRQLRDYTRLRADLTRERPRYWQRLKKLLEDALIKVSSVASRLTTVPARDMIEALIAGERDSEVLAGLARGRMRVKHAALAEGLTGKFDDHHAELARILLTQIDYLTSQVDHLTARVEQLVAAIPAAQGIDADGTTGPGAGTGQDAAALPALTRLDDIPGISRAVAQVASFVRTYRGCSPLPTAPGQAGRGPLFARTDRSRGLPDHWHRRETGAGTGQRLPLCWWPRAVRTDEHRPRRSEGAVTGHEQLRSELTNKTTQAIIAEIGLDMSRFATPGYLVSWAKRTPRTIQSGAKSRDGKTGKGNPYLKGLLGEAAASAARTDTFLGERYRRLVRRRGKLKALLAVARTILVIIWHLLTNRTARFKELGAAYYASRINKDKKTRGHVRQLEALGYTVTLAPAA